MTMDILCSVRLVIVNVFSTGSVMIRKDRWNCEIHTQILLVQCHTKWTCDDEGMNLFYSSTGAQGSA